MKTNTLIVYPLDGDSYPFDWITPDDDDPASSVGKPWTPGTAWDPDDMSQDQIESFYQKWAAPRFPDERYDH